MAPWGRALALFALPWLIALAIGFGSLPLFSLACGWSLLLLLAWLSSRGAVSGLRVRREIHTSAFEGDAVVAELVLENHSERDAFLLELGDVFGAGLADRQRLLEPGPLAARRRRRLRYRTAVTRDWGVYALGPLALAGGDPLGLFGVERLEGGIDSFSVFPRVHDVAALDRLGARPTLAPQEATGGRPGQSSAYMGIRDYRPEDGMRRIHWPATARLGVPVVKEFEVDLAPQFALFLDLDRRHRAGTGRKSTLEYVVRIAASLLWSAIARDLAVEVHGESRHPILVPSGRGGGHLAHCLDEMIRVKLDGTTDVLDLLELHAGGLAPGATVAVLFGTIRVDLARLAETRAALADRALRPLFVFVNSDSFAPVDKWPLPRAAMLEREGELKALLRSHAVPGAVLGLEQELADELGRPELFEAGA